MSIPIPVPIVKRRDVPVVEARPPEIYTWSVEGVLPPYSNRKFPQNIHVMVMAGSMEDAIDKCKKHYGSITLIRVGRDRNVDHVIT